jgi:hypothetical protein
MRNGSSE